ncbi:MAG: ROK family protein [Bacteroidota bacterium]|nr:ROK family protein [Bacteroidota bacterium]
MEKLLCGVDLGGTKLSVGLVQSSGKILDRIVVYDHVGKEDEVIVNYITQLVRKIILANGLEESDLTGIGVGFPGHVRYRDGYTITTSNLKGFKNFPFRDILAKNFTIPVRLDNDANAQAYCELRYGAGRGYDDLIFLTISTGIGAGIILGRKLYRGNTGTAGEFGHTIVDPGSDLVCTCGNKGCLMGCACGLALPHHFRKKLESGIKTTLQLPADFSYDKVDGQLISRGVAAGDPLCTAIVMECADYIGIGVYNIFQVFNPPVIILGGGLCNLGEMYMTRIKEKFYELARDMIFDPIAIVESEAGSDAGLIGAAALLLE